MFHICMGVEKTGITEGLNILLIVKVEVFHIHIKILRAEYIQRLQQHSKKMSVFKMENQRVLLFTTMDSLFLLCAKYQKVKLRQ